jgi:hypothetical protein
MRILLLTFAVVSAAAAAEQVKYQNNFEQAKLDSVPEEFLIQDGAFGVKEEANNKFLELPGTPLESYGLFFGPNTKENTAVSARIFGTSKGRRAPTFGVGLNGVAGYKLRVSPGKKAIELYRGDEVKASVPFEWRSGKWTFLQLRVVKTGAEWKLEGKVWTDGEKESAATSINWNDKEEPPQGRAMIVASPFSGTPIRFDDFLVVQTET